MAKVYMFRHQHAGIVTSHAFTEPPTPAQIAPLRAECERLHGREGWGMIHEAELLGADKIPSIPVRATGPAELPGPTISAVGTVTP